MQGVKTVLRIALSMAALWTAAENSSAATFSIDKTDNGTTLISVEGQILFEDEKKFNEIASKYDKAVVLLHSDGGSTAAAIKIGETIRLKGYSTSVFNGFNCDSACALIWLAGSPRIMSRTSRVGFHATYTGESGKEQESGLGNAIVGRYLTLLNLPERAVIFASSASPSELNYLTSENLVNSGIDATVIDDIENKSVATASDARSDASSDKTTDSLPWGTVGHWKVAVDPTMGNSCFIMSSWVGGTVLRIGFKQSDENSGYFLIGNDSWVSLTVGKEYDIQLKFGNEIPWTAPAKAVAMSGSKYLFGSFNDKRLWSEFRAAKMLALSYNGKPAGNLNIEQGEEVFQEMHRCQLKQVKIPADPFAQ